MIFLEGQVILVGTNFAGTNLPELVFDHKTRKIFCLTKLAKFSASQKFLLLRYCANLVVDRRQTIFACLVACLSGTSALLFNNVNSLVTHENKGE